MSKNEMNDFKVRVLTNVAKMLKEDNGDLPPLLYAKTNQGKHKIMPVLPDLFCKELRDEALVVMRKMNKVANAELSCFVVRAVLGAIRKDSLDDKLLREIEAAIKNSDRTGNPPPPEIVKKMRDLSSKSSHDTVILNFEAKRDDAYNEIMMFTVEKDGTLTPSGLSKQISNEGEDAQKMMQETGVFTGLFDK